MPRYLDWARTKIADAPETTCAFWVDLDQVLSEHNGGGLVDTDRQTVTDDKGNEWQVVRYRANPFPSRRQLSDLSQRTVVWCVGMPGDETVDVTPFEDYFGRTWRFLDVSLMSVADERFPGLELPRDLGRAVAGIRFGVEAYLTALATRHEHLAVTMASATNVLAATLTRRENAVVPVDAAAAIVRSQQRLLLQVTRMPS